MVQPLLRTFDEIEGTELSLVGGKAFRLSILKQQEFNIPQGLVLTTVFFESHLRQCHLMPLWAGSPDVAVTTESLEWLASTLKTRPLAPELLKLLNTHLERTFGPAINQFAVRSSAIDEDQRDHTFAGVHLTELGVPRTALPIAITRCWASALSGRAVEYRQAHSMSIQSIRIAVLIQPMLAPTSSGVGFTINPLTGVRDELVIEATWGLGEALVGGDIQPYFYRLSAQPPDYPLLEQRPGNVAPPAQLQASEQEPLPPAALTELAIHLEKIQALMGEPQDVEWVWQDSSFHFLQTRPVSLPAQPAPTVDQEWSRGSHPEFLPELPSPLFNSLIERTQSQALIFFRKMNLDIEGLGPYVRVILGRPYLNLTLLKRVVTQVGLSPGSVLHTIGHTEPGARGNYLSIDWETVWRARQVYWQVLKQFLNSSRSLKAYRNLVNEISHNLADINIEAPLPILLGQLREHERAYAELFNTNLGLVSSISAITTIGSSLIAPLTESPAAFLSALALKGIKTGEGELNQALLELAQQARRSEEAQEYFRDDSAQFENYQQGSALPPQIEQDFAALLGRYGQRAVYEADLGWPRYADDPASLLRIIRRYVQSAQLSDSFQPAEPAEKTALTGTHLADQATGVNRLFPWRRWLAAILVKFLRRLLRMREELNSLRGRAMSACRRWDLALAQSWVAKGWLARPEDIFWLTLEEIERTLMIKEDMGVTLTSIVQARKDTYQTYAQTEMPFSILESQIPYIQLGRGLSSETPSGVIMGLPISPGQIQGEIVVLHSPDDFEKLAGEIILVMPSTDPAWLPLLNLAHGLIVETGGLLSHGSVIAREYGLPAVANIPQATKRFRTGDRVLVDGSTGIVQLLESAPSSPERKLLDP